MIRQGLQWVMTAEGRAWIRPLELSLQTYARVSLVYMKESSRVRLEVSSLCVNGTAAKKTPLLKQRLHRVVCEEVQRLSSARLL